MTDSECKKKNKYREGKGRNPNVNKQLKQLKVATMYLLYNGPATIVWVAAKFVRSRRRGKPSLKRAKSPHDDPKPVDLSMIRMKQA